MATLLYRSWVSGDAYAVLQFVSRVHDGTARGLDESLIISTSASQNHYEETEDSLSLESRLPSTDDYNSKSPSINPSFMRNMEISKFTSLAKTFDDAGQRSAECHMVKSTSSDAPVTLGTPVCASEVTAALLGASTSSLCGFRRHRKIEEEDLSTPYNHYKCLSPKQRVGKLLRRQFSLDRAEETIRIEDNILVSVIGNLSMTEKNRAKEFDKYKFEYVISII
ncbi:hypothetical protein JTB14_027660 [Gonioctena quinquepunctata]|nr:hypothetical protein JTB14_027660 [Gonioctena quinquepunctata]